MANSIVGNLCKLFKYEVGDATHLEGNEPPIA